eukprot:2843223-Pyramimonas_sp.AAC.1
MLKGPKACSFEETRALAMLSVFGALFSCRLTILLEAHIKTVAPKGCQLYVRSAAESLRELGVDPEIVCA